MVIAIIVLVIQMTLVVMMVKRITTMVQLSAQMQARIVNLLEEIVKKSNEEK